MKKAAVIALSLIILCFSLAGCGEKSPEHTMKGTVNAIGNHIDFTVIENSYVSGVFWALTDDNTVYIFEGGEAATRDDISEGTVITVEYSGQIMMSYPGQIYAKRVIIHK